MIARPAPDSQIVGETVYDDAAFGPENLNWPAARIRESVDAAEAYTVRMTVGASGFEPKRPTVPIGVVRFVVTAREGDHCFAIPSLDVEKRVRFGRPLEVDVAFDRAGEFPFLCCVEGSGTAEVGAIVVASGK